MRNRARHALVSLLAAWFYLLAAIQPALHSCDPHHESHVPMSGSGTSAISPPADSSPAEEHDADHECIACHLGLVSRDLPPEQVRIAPPVLVLPIENDRPVPRIILLAESHLPRGPPTA